MTKQNFCCICFENDIDTNFIKAENFISECNCAAIYHVFCLSAWFNTKKQVQCPICKINKTNNVRMDSIIPNNKSQMIVDNIINYVDVLLNWLLMYGMNSKWCVFSIIYFVLFYIVNCILVIFVLLPFFATIFIHHCLNDLYKKAYGYLSHR